MKLKLLITCFAALGTLASAGAAIVYYRVGYISYHTQISDDPPIDETYYFYSDIAGDTIGDTEAGVITFPDLSFGDYSPSQGSYLVYYSPLYGTSAELESAYPPGTYDLAVTAGTEIGNAPLAVGPVDFATTIPYLINGSYSSLQNAPAGVPVTITYNTFVNGGIAPFTFTRFDMQSYSVPGISFQDSGDGATKDSTTIPAEEMRSGHTYGYSLTYYSYHFYSDSGFGTADGYVDFARSTGGFFHVLAEPGTVDGQIYPIGHVYTLGLPVNIQVRDSGGNVVDNQDISIGYENWYVFDTTATGVVSVRYYTPHFLSTVVTGLDLSFGQDYINVNLRAGDINLDNEVSLADYVLLADAFGALPGDPNWNPAADINGDLEVSLPDYSLLAEFFGEIGDE